MNMGSHASSSATLREDLQKMIESAYPSRSQFSAPFMGTFGCTTLDTFAA